MCTPSCSVLGKTPEVLMEGRTSLPQTCTNSERNTSVQTSPYIYQIYKITMTFSQDHSPFHCGSHNMYIQHNPVSHDNITSYKFCQVTT